jgi:hypothetical protein
MRRGDTARAVGPAGMIPAGLQIAPQTRPRAWAGSA